MKVCIAEKPSVAKDIAKVIGAHQKKDGYYEGNGYQVTWTFGHLCTLKEPQDYAPEWKSWDLNYLPMIPPSFGIKVIDNAGVKKQFKIIQNLVTNTEVEEVINCGDAGQEGELIQRWVLLKAKSKAPLRRLWISSLTEEAIKEGFANLRLGSQYENLFAAGQARAIGDWLLGMNATRLFTKKFAPPKTVLSIGRVQTPTLAMIVKRQKEIDAFNSEEYWELKTIYKTVEFTADIPRLKSEDKAKNGLAFINNREFEIINFEVKEGKEKNPRLFDLTSLQVEANKKYAYSAENTLKYIQSLYEKKFVTYPRVDTTYLSEDIYPKVSGILQKLVAYQPLVEPLLQKPIAKSKAVFDDTKVTDHHAIIPTEIFPQGLNLDEKRIYDLVARRFIAVFYPECKVANTNVEGKVENTGKDGDLTSINFKASGKQILEMGWREVYVKDKQEDKKDDEEKIMPIFNIGEKGPHEPFIHKGKTTPPKFYSEATLLRAMETAGRQVDDEEMRELMKDNGIGRPSTRANIIETLFKRKYIEKKKRNIIATQTGIDLIDTIQDELLKSPELTGVWERKLRLMEKGEYELETFKQELISMVTELTNSVKKSYFRPIASHTTKNVEEKQSKPKKEKEKILIEDSTCPKCKEHKIVKGKTAYGCANFKACGFMIPFEIGGKKLTDNQIHQLLTKQKTVKIKGFVDVNTNEKFDAKLVLDPMYKLDFER
ncbi:type IA DNA topoisomerase [Faecalibacter bovis]|uniref:DNA topoisomerase n=1 Tax=Faecalibacter bovis TaxID=2898187 RepID=A0ABX7X9X7_9FLAO|nr:type IA DNA topoisomerase [Faecalibacter bovis]QTV04686.1 DNA topoisomerase 3 [Faecalibacter bovis]